LDSSTVSTEAKSARLTLAGRVILIVLAFWALALIVPALQRVFDSLDSYGLSVDNDGIVTDVATLFPSAAGSPAADAGITPGDRIDLKAMRCIPASAPQCASLAALLGGLGGMHDTLPNRPITLTVLPQSGAPARTVELRSAPAPLNSAERLVLFADTAVGVAVITLAFWLVWTRPGWMTWGLFLYVIWFNPGQMVTYYAILQQWPAAVFAQEIVESLAQGAAFAGLMIFALRFPRDRTEPRWQKVQWAAPLVGVGMAVLSLLTFGSMLGFSTERITEINFLASYVVDAAVLLILLSRRRVLSPEDEQRMRWVIWGCAIGLPAYILAEVAQSSDLIAHLGGAPPPQALIGLLYLPNGVLAYFASQAVWQRRVISVSIPLRHGTVLVALSLALGIPVVQLHEKLGLLQENIRLPGWIWPVVVAPVLLLALHRLHEGAVEVVDRIFNRKFHSARQQLKDASEEMGRAKTLAEIDDLLAESTVRALFLSSGAVFRCDGSVYRRARDAKGWNASMKKELQLGSDDAALRSLQAGCPVRLGEDDWNCVELPSGVQAPCLSVPVRSGVPEATAVILFGPHQTGTDINDDECEMLEGFADRAAVAYERVITAMVRKELARLKEEIAALQGRDSIEQAES